MTDLRTRIAAVTVQHRPEYDGGDTLVIGCLCGWRYPFDSNVEDFYDWHLADAVIRELDSHGWLIDPESGKRKTKREHGRVEQMPTDSLRTRIAAVLDKAMPESAADVGYYQRLGVTPLVDIEAYDLNLELLADAVIRELGPIPDREFTDQWGHHWEWCGGVTGTWAWRITRLERTP